MIISLSQVLAVEFLDQILVFSVFSDIYIYITSVHIHIYIPLHIYAYALTYIYIYTYMCTHTQIAFPAVTNTNSISFLKLSL